MSYALEITDFAQAAIEEILVWYAENESLIRAEKVRNSIYRTIDKITESPFVYKMYENTFNPRTLLRYAVVYNVHAIVYEIKETVIVVIDVFSLKRNPSLFKK